MRPEDELALSFYRTVSEISGERVTLVQHIETNELFVRKNLKTYDREVYAAIVKGKYPHIPAIAECIEDESGLIVIEEYIQGKRLDEVLEERRFSQEETREMALRICEILEPLHRHFPPIVHRDIKPGNLILRGDQLFLIDFDVSRDVDPREPRDTVLMGTRMYAAPEQFGFSQSTPRTDIYALGVLMNEMVTGTDPSQKKVGGSLGKIIEKCTAIDPENRYASVRELADALKGKAQSYAPPGFRSGRFVMMIPAVLWYMLIIGVSFSMEIHDTNGELAGPVETIVTRCMNLVILGGLTLYLCNYLSFLERFPFKRRTSIPLEILRILLGCAIIFCAPLVFVGIIFG